MRAGTPLPRLGAALACSLAAHAAAAWWLGGHLAPPGRAGEGGAVHARLNAPAAAPEPAAPPSSARGAARPASGVGAPADLPATRYYDAIELDVRPQVMSHVMPQYPEDVLSGTRGRVVVELYLSAEGHVDRALVALAVPPGKFDGAAARAFSGARFTPGVKAGKPVASRLVIEVTFGD